MEYDAYRKEVVSRAFAIHNKNKRVTHPTCRDSIKALSQTVYLYLKQSNQFWKMPNTTNFRVNKYGKKGGSMSNWSYIPEYVVSTDELNTFIDMFEIIPVYTTLYDIPPITLYICEDSTILNETWLTTFKNSHLTV